MRSLQADEMEITEVDGKILDELQEGARTQGYLVDAIGEPRHRVHPRLQLLDAARYIERIHEPTALYELRHDPREENQESDDSEADVDPDGGGGGR